MSEVFGEPLDVNIAPACLEANGLRRGVVKSNFPVFFFLNDCRRAIFYGKLVYLISI
jgi:hypothetical protein